MKRNIRETSLNNAQINAVMDNTYPFYLQAGAGGGKTLVLVKKILHILKTENVGLDNFAILSFTNKAADELAMRLQKELYQGWLSASNNERREKLRKQLSICNMTDISTIHRFCEKLIRNYGFHIGVAENFTVDSFRTEMKSIITGHINAYIGNEVIQDIPLHTIVGFIMDLLDENARKGLVIGRLTKNISFDTSDNEFFNKFKTLFIDVYAKSEEDIYKQKTRKNILTVDDLIVTSTKLFDNPYAAKCIATQYKFLFTDEFQDTNIEQFRLMQKMISAGIKVYAIGDEKQSIYAFRGADVDNVNRMKELLPNSDKKASLKINYRTDPKLMETINQLFCKPFTVKEDTFYFPYQALESGLTEDLCNTPLQIIYKKKITDIVSETVQNVTIGNKQAMYGDIAILCRSNAVLGLMARQLKEKNIPTEVMGGNFYTTTEVIDTYKLLNAVIYKNPSTILESKNTFYYRSLMQSSEGMNFEDLLLHLDTVAKSFTMQDILGILYETTHAFDYLRYKKQYQAVANLLKLKDKVNELVEYKMMKPLQFVDYLGSMINSGKDEDEAEVLRDDRECGVVSLYTIHRAKGLEFPIVIVPNCDKEIYRLASLPKIIFTNTKDSFELAFHNGFLNRENPAIDKDYQHLLKKRRKLCVDEELRIFYVVCTRAKNLLILANRQEEKAIRSRSDSASWIKWVLSEPKK